MELLKQNKEKIIMRQRNKKQASNHDHKYIENIASYQSRNSSENCKVRLLPSYSEPRILEAKAQKMNESNTINYPSNFGILMQTPFIWSQKTVNAKAIKFVRKQALKSRNHIDGNQEMSDSPFLKLSSDYLLRKNIHNDNDNGYSKYNIDNRNNKCNWRNNLVLDNESEFLSGLSNKNFHSKQFHSDEFFRTKNKYPTEERDIALNNFLSFKDDLLKKLQNKILTKTIEHIDRNNKVLYKSQSEKKINLQSENVILPMRYLTPHLNPLSFNQDNIKTQKLLGKNPQWNPNNLKLLFQNKTKDATSNWDQTNSTSMKKVLNLQTPLDQNKSNCLNQRISLNNGINQVKLNQKRRKTFESLMNDIVFKKGRMKTRFALFNHKKFDKDINKNNDHYQSPLHQHALHLFDSDNKPSTKQNLITIQSLPEISSNDNDQLFKEKPSFQLNCKNDQQELISDFSNKDSLLNWSQSDRLAQIKSKERKNEMIKSQNEQKEDNGKTLVLSDLCKQNYIVFNKTKKSLLRRGNTTSKQSDLKTDTDTKKGSLKQTTTESKQIVSMLIADFQPKENQNARITLLDENTVLKKIISKDIWTITSKADFCQSQLTHQTNKKYLDYFTQEAHTSSNRNYEDIISQRKRELLRKRISKMIIERNNNKHQSTKYIIQNFNQPMQIKLREECYSLDFIEMDYTFLNPKSNCLTSFSIANHICKHYILIDKNDFSDYLFN